MPAGTSSDSAGSRPRAPTTACPRRNNSAPTRPVPQPASSMRPPGATWVHADLATLDAAALGWPEPFDAAVLAGNVMPYLAPDTEAEVLRRVGLAVRPDGVLAVGFGLDRGYSLAAFDVDLRSAGLRLEHRFATWDLRPWTRQAGFAVSVLRRHAGLHPGPLPR